MFNTILVPLDGSTVAEHALPPAISLARKFRAVVKIVHVYEPDLALFNEGGWYDEATDRKLRESGQAYLDEVVERLSAAGFGGTSIRSELLIGPVAGTIERGAEEAGADLIAMTTHGRGLAARFWLGSVSDALVRRSNVPILLIRPQDQDPDLSQETKYGRMLIPLDASPLAEQILEPAASFATAMQAEVVLLRAVRHLAPDIQLSEGRRVGGIPPSMLKKLQEVDEQEKRTAEQYLEQIAERLRSRSLVVETRVVSHAQPATAIIDLASSGDIDLIALATHGRGGLQRLLIGSVADKVLRGATTPVLVYRPTDAAGSAKE